MKLTNNELQRFMELQESIKQLETELDALKATLKQGESFSTDKYTVLVEESIRSQAPSTTKLSEILSRESFELVKRNIQAIVYKTVKVRRL